MHSWTDVSVHVYACVCVLVMGRNEVHAAETEEVYLGADVGVRACGGKRG